MSSRRKNGKKTSGPIIVIDEIVHPVDTKSARSSRRERQRRKAMHKNKSKNVPDNKGSNKGQPAPWAVMMKQRTEENVHRARIGLQPLRMPKKKRTRRAAA